MRFPVKYVMSALWVLVGCSGDPVCGADDEGNEYPVCTYEIEKDLTIDYCPGDEWGSVDGCNSCACDGKGKILCTEIDCATAEN